jgi:tRNA (guanine37-N1)-methyltransferase
VRPFKEDGRDFIKAAGRRVREVPFPEFAPKISKSQAKKEKKMLLAGETRDVTLPLVSETASPPQLRLRRQISHFVMNLPDSAIEFLDAFRGIFAEPETRELYEGKLPMVHCHCFTKEVEDRRRAEGDIKQVSGALLFGCYKVPRRLTVSCVASGGEIGICAG